MEIDKARDAVLRWQYAVEQNMKSEVVIDESLTETREWGWIFSFVTTDESSPKRYRRFAVECKTGRCCPVGTKGIARALKYFEHHREKDRCSGNSTSSDASSDSCGANDARSENADEPGSLSGSEFKSRK